VIGYVTLGTNDLDKALAFYDALLGGIGATRLFALAENGFTMYGRSFDQQMIAITRPYDGGEARPGNGNMVALQMRSRGDVDRVHAHALQLGGSDEGAPGLRPPEEMGFYGGYFRDPEGNKLCAFHVGPGQ
jgi:catechol 2,3-dioxygenase-like lactoylglutathione lyase family enzyme